MVGRHSFVALAAMLCWAIGSQGTCQETQQLSEVIATAGAGEANGHSFTRLADLDPEITYTGGALILEDVCIHGNGATIDLAGECIVVMAGAGHTRLDIDHCLIVYGQAPCFDPDLLGGGVAYGPETQGWVVNNTFYDNEPCGLYLAEVWTYDDNVRISNNIFYWNVSWGLVRNEEQDDLHIHNNDSFGHSMGNYGKHCGCPTETPTEIHPPLGLPGSNLSLDPLFVAPPAPPKVEWDFHLLPDSPCIGAGESGEDLGAFPFNTNPAVWPCSWGFLKTRFLK